MFTKEQLLAMGLTEEQAQSILDGIGQVIPKSRFDEVNNAKKTLEQQVAGYETQLKDLQSKAKGNEELQAEITKLQEAQQQAKTQYEQQLQEERLNTALKLELANKVHDVDLVISQLDKSTIEIDEKGKIIKGFKEQHDALKESKSFLFVPEKDGKPPKFKGVDPASGTGTDEPLSDGAQFAKEFNEKGSSTSTGTSSLWGQ